MYTAMYILYGTKILDFTFILVKKKIKNDKDWLRYHIWKLKYLGNWISRFFSSKKKRLLKIFLGRANASHFEFFQSPQWFFFYYRYFLLFLISVVFHTTEEVLLLEL